MPSGVSVNVTIRPSLHLDGCTEGLWSEATAPYALIPVAPPKGWQPDSTQTVSIQLLLYKCERISIGPYSRGPVFIMLEAVSGGEPPSACQQGHPNGNPVLNKVWLSDSDVASYMKGQFNLPAEYAEINLTLTTVGPVIQQRWTFGLPGQQPSDLNETHVSPRDGTGDHGHRYFWVNQAGGITYADFNETWHTAGFDAGHTVGIIREPLLWGKIGIWEGEGRVFNTSVAADFAQFEDMQCKQPL